MAYQIIMGLADKIEDLIAKNSKAPAILQNELRGLLKEGVTVEDVSRALDESLIFGDPKLNEIVLANLRGNPLDAAYIQAIDFCERDFSEEIIGKMECACHDKDIAFLDTVVKPTFVTDWPVHKHEMVANFELPVYDAEHITENGDLRVLCSPTTVSMLEYISQSVPSIPANMVNEPERAEVLVSQAQDLELAKTVIEGIQGPTLDEYLKGLGLTTLEPCIVNDLTECEGLGLCKVKSSLHAPSEDFAEFKPVTQKGFMRLAEIIMNRARKGSAHKDNSEEEMEFVTPSDISKALIYTGTAAGREQYLEPEHLTLWKQMQEDGLDKVVPFGDGSLAKLLEDKPVPSPADEILIIMSKPTYADRVKEFGNYKLRAKPGDFFEVYKFCQNFSEKTRDKRYNLKSSDNTGAEVGEKVLGARSSGPGDAVDIGKYRDSAPNGGINVGDTAQKRGGSSSPNQGRGKR